MRDAHTVHLVLRPHRMVRRVLPHLLFRIQLGHVQRVAVGGQLEVDHGSDPLPHLLLGCGAGLLAVVLARGGCGAFMGGWDATDGYLMSI